MRLNKNKSIGKVIYIVEGDVDEEKLIQGVFGNVLGYQIVSYDKRSQKISVLQNPLNKYSTVYLVPAQFSAISKLSDSEAYLDNIYSCLANKYGLDVENSAIYYLFDRDEGSNSAQKIDELQNVLYNSRDNGNNMNGMLLISYPCIQAFALSAKGLTNDIATSREAKQRLGEPPYWGFKRI